MSIRYRDTGYRAADINGLSKTQSGEIQNKHLKYAKGRHIPHRQAMNTADDFASKCLEPKDEGAVLLVAIVVDVQQP